MAQYSALRCVSGIWQNNEKPLISNGLRFVVTCLLTAALWVLFHKARHNFGTHITLSLGVPIETVSRMMGHKSITTTQIYAHVTDRKVDEDMKRLRMQALGSEITLIDESMDEEMQKRRKYNFRNKTRNGL